MENPQTSIVQPASDDARSEFVVVANRLPVKIADDGSWSLSPGGLVSAMLPVMRERTGAWVGWDGSAGGDHQRFEFEGIRLSTVGLSAQEHDEYYSGACNETIWPLYHGSLEAAQFHRETWATYRTVNQRFADAACRELDEGGTAWVHDYQLQLVPSMIREQRPDVTIGYYLHIPFPPLELLARLPWRRQVLDGLLGADVVGLQTQADARNVLSGVQRFCDADDVAMAAEGGVVRAGANTSVVKAFPISVDYRAIAHQSDSDDVEIGVKQLREELGNPEVVLLGVDRLDYTKGIDLRLKAIHELLIEGRLDPHKTAVVQVAVPSREDVLGYEEVRNRVEQLVGTINGDFGELGQPVVQYMHKSLPFAELLVLYRAADVLLVTPFQDGMNLVSKEYAAARVDDRGALVLSEFAGAAEELTDAFLVNPYDTEGLKDQIEAAVVMGDDEEMRRMHAMRARVERNDLEGWARAFLALLAMA
ncbi:MAG: trehalose-6-phosphate synthase [Acidimicrobiales bacterium]|nr:trehalose-6-phosphate synthase [Acidimicrobiales bacterium]